jgi:predicted O-methyltransferase YrrM
VRYFNARHILELGTNLGVGTQAMAQHPEAQISSMEGCPELFQYSASRLKPYDNIHLIQSNFKDGLAALDKRQWDLIFIDGHHDKEATLAYFESLLSATHKDTVIILDDINWSAGMQEAWQAIKTHPKVRLTVDTFFWGLVFFREGQAKEHFHIRL